MRRGSMGDKRPADVRGREGASKCMRGLVYLHMNTHRVYGMRALAGAGVQI